SSIPHTRVGNGSLIRDLLRRSVTSLRSRRVAAGSRRRSISPLRDSLSSVSRSDSGLAKSHLIIFCGEILLSLQKSCKGWRMPFFVAGSCCFRRDSVFEEPDQAEGRKLRKK